MSVMRRRFPAQEHVRGDEPAASAGVVSGQHPRPSQSGTHRRPPVARPVSRVAALSRFAERCCPGPLPALAVFFRRQNISVVIAAPIAAATVVLLRVMASLVVSLVARVWVELRGQAIDGLLVGLIAGVVGVVVELAQLA